MSEMNETINNNKQATMVLSDAINMAPLLLSEEDQHGENNAQ